MSSETSIPRSLYCASKILISELSTCMNPHNAPLYVAIHRVKTTLLSGGLFLLKFQIIFMALFRFNVTLSRNLLQI
jgi:hypothetical protein